MLPKTAAPRVGGGAFGGMGGALMEMFLEQALTSAVETPEPSAEAEAAAQAEAAAAQQQVEALQAAVRQQQKLQEEREAKFVSQLLDRPAMDIIGGSGDLGILETARAEAGSPFDGNDPHATWTAVHDAWFTPDPAGAVRSGSSPVPIGESPVAPSLRPMDCLGKLCAFPPGSAQVPLVKTAPTGLSSQPSTASSPTVSGVVTEWRQVDNRVVWAARREGAGAMQSARQSEIPAIVLGSGAVNWAERALPGMQQEIAREGRGIYQRVMEDIIAETFGVISDAVSGRFQEALARSDTIGDRVRESILPQFKLARLVLSGEGEAAGEVAGEAVWEQAKEVAKERSKELLDILPVPEAVKEGLGHSADMTDHWLQMIGAK